MGPVGHRLLSFCAILFLDTCAHTRIREHAWFLTVLHSKYNCSSMHTSFRDDKQHTQQLASEMTVDGTGHGTGQRHLP